MKPSIGRIVHFHSVHEITRQPILHAAIITDVVNDECVNLTVFSNNGLPYPLLGVQMGGDYGKWSWPERV